LRRLLASALSGEPHRTAKDVLTTQYDGYLLAVPSKEIDVSEFKRLTKSGFAAFDAGDDYEAFPGSGLGVVARWLSTLPP
jgi:hypothetical protein